MLSVAAAVERLRGLASTPELAGLSHAFSAAGQELALVGGSVRDAFLDRELSDLDLTTSARPDEILAIVAPLADAHWDVGREFGTIGARLGGATVEITTYRSDAYSGESRKPVVAFGDTLEGDLVRRDFTMNAMALVLAPGPEPRLVDPTGGLDDLLAGRLRTPSPPEVSFGDDPLRMMRAARFAAQLGAQLDPEAFAAAQRLADRIGIVSAERVRDELTKLLLSSRPVTGIRLLVDTGLADLVLPEVPALRLEIDEHARHKDVYEHSLTALEQAIELERARGHAPDLVLRLAVLMHDIGKPATRVIEPGERSASTTTTRSAPGWRRSDCASCVSTTPSSRPSRSSSGCTCASSATRTVRGPTPRCVVTCGMPAPSSNGCTSSRAPT
ncbi:hypothetical protein GCM10025881_20040 [Pseudolysinimonas kribbensis]|uniref:CCA tRNA nucleotidyltransferase n=1 Tax=Pseudolysinimonas kribbensis TaxID=433641 RepID=A0ABQ6K6E0_9MICO|nr:hypothetical protein GCM10025881_20040 [Pseudolysinimonas kribbensis]